MLVVVVGGVVPQEVLVTKVAVHWFVILVYLKVGWMTLTYFKGPYCYSAWGRLVG